MDKPRIEAAVRELLLAIGEDPDREGLQETPRRVAEMYGEIFSGLEETPEKHMKLFNETKHDEMVTVRDIPLYSMCEHHLLPFIGVAHIAYIPRDGRVIGLSKLARIVNAFARRPQLQERLTAQLADFLEEKLEPQGVAVIIGGAGRRRQDPDLRPARPDEGGSTRQSGGPGSADSGKVKAGRERPLPTVLSCSRRKRLFK